MASNQMLVLVAAALAVAFLPALATATEHWVGDDNGWTLNFNYSNWAESKQFKVGDTLVFKYSNAKHTVVEVNGADFAACSMPGDSKVMATGQDKVTLGEAGRRWFICSVGAHCENGMKVKINVLSAEEAAAAEAPSATPPPPSSPAAKLQPRLAQAALAVTAAIAAVLVF